MGSLESRCRTSYLSLDHSSRLLSFRENCILCAHFRRHSIPKIWRKAKVIAVEKPGKDPSLAANYRPISLLSVCYKLLERLALQRISPTVEGLLSPDQAGFRKGTRHSLMRYWENLRTLRRPVYIRKRVRSVIVYAHNERLRHKNKTFGLFVLTVNREQSYAVFQV